MALHKWHSLECIMLFLPEYGNNKQHQILRTYLKLFTSLLVFGSECSVFCPSEEAVQPVEVDLCWCPDKKTYAVICSELHDLEGIWEFRVCLLVFFSLCVPALAPCVREQGDFPFVSWSLAVSLWIQVSISYCWMNVVSLIVVTSGSGHVLLILYSSCLLIFRVHSVHQNFRWWWNCPLWWLPCGCWALEMWRVQVRKCIFNFIKVLEFFYPNIYHLP